MSSLPSLILFAKAPVAGRVKTRLQTHCSAAAAADIAKALMQMTIDQAVRHWPGRVVLAVWPDQQHAFLQRMMQRYSLAVVQQVDGDLGQKMHRAMQEVGYPAAVMGCDVPHCSPSILQAVYQSLRQNVAAIGPATDGGYYLLALPGPEPELFTDVAWGTAEVFAQTQSRADARDVRLRQLPALRDIDDWDDLRAAAVQLPQLRAYLDTAAG